MFLCIYLLLSLAALFGLYTTGRAGVVSSLHIRQQEVGADILPKQAVQEPSYCSRAPLHACGGVGCLALLPLLQLRDDKRAWTAALSARWAQGNGGVVRSSCHQRMEWKGLAMETVSCFFVRSSQHIPGVTTPTYLPVLCCGMVPIKEKVSIAV